MDDVIIGANRADPNGYFNAGESYVVFGGPSVGASGALDLSALNGSNGFVLNGVDSYDRSGYSVSAAGDINGDGVDDVIIGAFGADPNGNSYAGESYVVFGIQTSVSTQLPANQWTMLGIPGNSVETTLDDVFESVLPDEEYGVSWIAYEYGVFDSELKYRVMSLQDSFKPGVGYWFIQDVSPVVNMKISLNNKPVDFPNDDCIVSDECFVRGFDGLSVGNVTWTMLANPYAVPTPLDDVFLRVEDVNGQASVRLDEVTGVFEHSAGLYVYDGSIGAYVFSSVGDELSPLQAGWLGIRGLSEEPDRGYVGFDPEP